MERVPKPVGLALTGLGKPRTAGEGVSARLEEDRELVRRAQKDDKEAFEELVRRHQSRVFAVAGGILRNREDVEDIAQQVFLKAYFSIRRFDQRAAFSTWLYKITVMLVLKEVQGFSVEEIANLMEINANTVKVRLFRARQRITERMRRRRAAAAR
jgi:RNA polymerase sigma-70 factor (ECF subfamily)